jgi:hypothetical protein
MVDGEVERRAVGAGLTAGDDRDRVWIEHQFFKTYHAEARPRGGKTANRR